MNTKLIRRLPQSLTLLCVLVLILAGCSPSPATVIPSNVPSPAPAKGPYWPTSAWRTSPPEEQGLDSQKLAQMLAAIRQKNLNLHSLLVIRNGYLVSESYFGRYQPGTPHELYSCTKSFVSTLIGIAIDKGYIDRIDHRILDFFPQGRFSNLDPQKEAITLEDVLAMETGLDWQEDDASIRAMYQSPDWVKFMLDKPVILPPGSQFNYCSGCSHLLSAILEQTTGMNPRDFAEQTLFKPLGITNAKWDTDTAGIPIGGWGLQISPRDMAKLGYLVLHHGQWDGQQIVSSKWLEVATQMQTETGGDLGYGYQWWTYPKLEAYAALGRDGQTIFMVPGSDLIVVTTAEMDGHEEIFKLIEEYIFPAVREQVILTKEKKWPVSYA